MATLYKKGIPTKVDVEKLLNEFGVPEEGQQISYEDMEKCLGLSRRTYRFNTVMDAWRKHLYREHNVEMGANPGVGLVVLTPEERVTKSVGHIESGTRKYVRGGRLAASTDSDRLSREGRKTQDHIVSWTNRIAQAWSFERKKLQWPIPKIKPNPNGIAQGSEQ